MYEDFQIIRLVNANPFKLPKIKKTEIEKCESVTFNYTESMITQIVKYRNDEEMRFICAQLQNFIEENGIDVCFVINEDELKDCLQNHNMLKHEVMDLKSKLETKENHIFCTESHGKFKNADKLYESYLKLEKEYTKTRQELSKKNAEFETLKNLKVKEAGEVLSTVISTLTDVITQKLDSATILDFVRKHDIDKTNSIINVLEDIQGYLRRQIMITTDKATDLEEAEAKGCNDVIHDLIDKLDKRIKCLKGDK